jgi:hypothetical protein
MNQLVEGFTCEQRFKISEWKVEVFEYIGNIQFNIQKISSDPAKTNY